MNKKDEKGIYRKWYVDRYEIEENNTEDVNLILDFLGDKPKRVLEVACGSGRILIPMAKRGHEVTGFDMDEDMMAKIHEKAKGLNSFSVLNMDALKGAWGSDYDAVIMGGNILVNIMAGDNMSYSKAQQLFINKAAAALKTGGHLYMDFSCFAHAEKVLAADNGRIIFAGVDSTGVSGTHQVIGDGYDVETGMAYGRRITLLTTVDGNSIEIKEHWKKHFPSLEEVHQWLNDAGLTVKEEYGDFNKNPLTETTNVAVIWAEKL